FRRRPLLGADGFVFNTNRRGFESGSHGQEEPAGLALLDVVMDQFHRRGTTAVQPALRSKPGTARSAGRHLADNRIIGRSGPANKDRGETRACLKEAPGLSSVGGRRIAQRSRGPKRGSRRRRKQL